jgi:ubiquinone/menaquinone biosynthesis C-methylase UbiE
MGVLGDGEHLPITSGWADVVDMSGVVDHFDDPAEAFAEAARVLRPGGTLTVTLTNDGSWYRRLARRLGRSTADGVHHGAYAVSDIVALAESAGFRITGTTTVAYLRLPRRIERVTTTVAPERLERLVEGVDAGLRRVLGPHHGGMMLVAAARP